MYKSFAGSRRSGKTYNAIIDASNNNFILLCNNPLYTSNKIDDLFNLKIITNKPPIGSYDDFIESRFIGCNGYIIDDFELFMSKLSKGREVVSYGSFEQNIL